MADVFEIDSNFFDKSLDLIKSTRPLLLTDKCNSQIYTSYRPF